MKAINELLNIPVPSRNRYLLPASMLSAYDSLTEGIRNFKKYICLQDPCGDVERNLNLLLSFVVNDNPAAFWVGESYRYSLSDGTIDLIVDYIPKSESEEYAEKLINVVKKVDSVTEVTRDVPSVAVSVHDYLASTIIYDLNATLCHTAVGALLQGRAVCDGIAAATSLMLNHAGIKCETMSGKFRGSSEVWHAWNRVFCKDGTMHMDVTNDLQSKLGYVSHKYFFLSKEKAIKILSWMDDQEHNSDFDYYSRVGRYAESIGDVEKIMSDCAGRGISVAEMGVNSCLSEEQLLDSVVTTYAPFRDNLSITYQLDRELNVFTYMVNAEE